MTEVIPIKKVEILSPEEADAFRNFRKHREKFEILQAAGVFDTLFGKVSINLHNGQIQSVNIDNETYSIRRK